jgi:hypothetical protein
MGEQNKQNKPVNEEFEQQIYQSLRQSFLRVYAVKERRMKSDERTEQTETRTDGGGTDAPDVAAQFSVERGGGGGGFHGLALARHAA